MPCSFATLPLLFADNAPPAANPANSGILLYLLPLMAMFYFFMIRPQQQQEKKRRQMLDALKKNDRVLTAAGIYGTVVSVDTEHDKVVLRVDDDKGIKLAFSKGSVVRVVDVSQEKEKAAESA